MCCVVTVFTLYRILNRTRSRSAALPSPEHVFYVFLRKKLLNVSCFVPPPPLTPAGVALGGRAAHRPSGYRVCPGKDPGGHRALSRARHLQRDRRAKPFAEPPFCVPLCGGRGSGGDRSVVPIVADALVGNCICGRRAAGLVVL